MQHALDLKKQKRPKTQNKPNADANHFYPNGAYMYSFRIIALGTQWKFLTVNNSQTVNIFFTCYSWQKNYLIAVINLERN